MDWKDGASGWQSEVVNRKERWSNRRLEVLPTRCYDKLEYLKSLEIKSRWSTQAPKGESYA